MYVGRIVSVGKTKDGKICAMYRVSSNSFPNRQAVEVERGIAIVPKPGHEEDIMKNPYIAYNCLRISQDGQYAIATNGSHTDPITEKIDAGMNMRDALVSGLFGMDYEHDHLGTPRIASIVNLKTGEAALGTVREDALHVTRVKLEAGQAFYVATYNHNTPSVHLKDDAFDVSSADDACDYILGKGIFADLEKPISAVCAVAEGDKFQVAFKDK